MRNEDFYYKFARQQAIAATRSVWIQRNDKKLCLCGSEEHCVHCRHAAARRYLALMNLCDELAASGYRLPTPEMKTPIVSPALQVSIISSYVHHVQIISC